MAAFSHTSEVSLGLETTTPWADGLIRHIAWRVGPSPGPRLINHSVGELAAPSSPREQANRRVPTKPHGYVGQ